MKGFYTTGQTFQFAHSDFLSQTPAFEDASDCDIVITRNGKVEPVVTSSMVFKTELFDVEDEH